MYIVPKPQHFQIDNSKKYKLTKDVNYIQNEALKDEEYKITINEKGISAEYKNDESKFRADSTLKQIFSQTENEYPEITIHDYPHIKNRGIMLDISRGKLPNLDTLKKLVDFMSDLKYNQLQLYMESFVFEYKNFLEYCKDTEPITVEEMKELEKYAKEKFVELVPNQNGFGHMGAWIEKEELSHLGIKRDADKEVAVNPIFSKLTDVSPVLNPLDEGSLELMDKIYDCTLPVFSSDKVNIGMDEPFELGQGQTKEACEKYGIGTVYTDYLIKVCDLAYKKYNKTPMFWADIAFKHEEQLERIPKNAVVMEWGYEMEHPYDRHLRKLKDLGLKFYVCPGTSSWSSIAGRFNNAVFNIYSSAEVGYYYNAEGFLLTDWGDRGHPQFPPISNFMYAFGASYSWNAGSHNNEIAYVERQEVLENCTKFMDNYYKVKGEKSLSEIINKMSNYYLLEDELVFNRTLLEKQIAEIDETAKMKSSATFISPYTYMKDIREQLNEVECEAVNELREAKCNCDMVIAFYETFIYLTDNALGFAKEELTKKLESIKKEFLELWLKKNKKTGSELYLGVIDEVVSKIK